MSDPKTRREWIVAFVGKRRRVPLADTCQATLEHWRCSDSTFYEDVKWLVAHEKLQRTPTGQGDDLVVWGTLQGVADPRFVHERARCVLNSRLKRVLRTRCAEDLLCLAERSYLLPDEALLRVFQSAIRQPDLPGRTTILGLLNSIAIRTSAQVAAEKFTREDERRTGDQNSEELDWPDLLETLRRKVEPVLWEQMERNIEVASWACEILFHLWAATPKQRLARQLIELALARAYPMVAFKRGFPSFSGVLKAAIEADDDAALKFWVLHRLDNTLNTARQKEIREQARMLRDELGASILP